MQFNRSIILYLLVMVPSLILSQDDIVLNIEIVSRVAFDYRIDTLSGYRLDKDSTHLLIDLTGDCYVSDTFMNYDKISILDEDYELYTFSENYHIYRSRSGIEVAELNFLLDELGFDNYIKYRNGDTLRINDSLDVFMPVELLIPTDFDFSYLDLDTTYFLDLIKINKNYVMSFDNPNGDEIIKSYLEDWISSNFYEHNISFEKNLRFRINFTSGRSIELYQYHPGGNNCKWRVKDNSIEYTVFNPYINEVIASAVDSRYGNLKRDLLEYRSILHIIGRR